MSKDRIEVVERPSGACLNGVMRVSGECFRWFLVSGKSLQSLQKVFGGCLKGFKDGA